MAGVCSTTAALLQCLKVAHPFATVSYILTLHDVRVSSVGFGVADRQPGNFKLDVAAIEAVRV